MSDTQLSPGVITRTNNASSYKNVPLPPAKIPVSDFFPAVLAVATPYLIPTSLSSYFLPRVLPLLLLLLPVLFSLPFTCVLLVVIPSLIPTSPSSYLLPSSCSSSYTVATTTITILFPAFPDVLGVDIPYLILRSPSYHFLSS